MTDDQELADRLTAQAKAEGRLECFSHYFRECIAAGAPIPNEVWDEHDSLRLATGGAPKKFNVKVAAYLNVKRLVFQNGLDRITAVEYTLECEEFAALSLKKNGKPRGVRKGNDYASAGHVSLWNVINGRDQETRHDLARMGEWIKPNKWPR